jgi:GNAT superfamily N-acetyltransferase
VRIEALTPDTLVANLPALCALLEDCVEGGASIGFLWPMSDGEAEAYWRSCIAPITEGSRVLLVARDEAGSIVGTGQLDLAMRANGRHRAEVMKLMVHPSARRNGHARALMAALEDEARRLGRTTLVLDTNDDSPAELLYRSLGWNFVGGIPDYALLTDGTPHKNAIFYKLLE